MTTDRKAGHTKGRGYLVHRRVVCTQEILVKCATSAADAKRQVDERAFISDMDFEQMECVHTEVDCYRNAHHAELDDAGVRAAIARAKGEA